MSHLNINGVDKPLDHIRLNNVMSENLVDDPSTYVNGYINSSGNLVGQSTTNLEKTSPFMPIPSGTTELTLSSKDAFPSGANGVWIAIACYSSNTFDSFLGRRTSSEQILAYEIPAGTKYARVSLRTYGDTVYCMLNEGSTAKPYYPYLITKEAWEARDKSDHLLWGRADTFTGTNSISARCYGLPVKSWEIDGNTQQSGTPAPDDPICPEFVGEKTTNLLPPKSTTTYKGITFAMQPDGTTLCNGTADGEFAFGWSVPASISGDYYFSGCPAGGSNQTYDVFCYDKTAAARPKRWDGTSASLSDFGATKNNEVKIVSGHDTEVRISFRDGYKAENLVFSMMLRAPSSPSNFEPFGYKLNITSAGQTVPVYLGQVQTLRRIKKKIFTGDQAEDWHLTNGVFYSADISDYLRVNAITTICSHYPSAKNASGTSYVAEKTICMGTGSNDRLFIRDSDFSSAANFRAFLVEQYQNGAPLTVWYVLAEPETGIVNEPLCKIGDYTDTLTSDQAGITVPTTDGSTTISVDTTLAPSRFEIKVHAKPIHYGFKIDKSISDPSNAVIYTHDAVTMTPAGMDFTNGVFDYGSWENVWFIKNARPVMLNFDGTEAYDLDPNDYSKKLDGTPSDIADSTKTMNAMIAFPTVWIKRTDDASYNYIEISDSQLDSDFHAYAHEDANGVVKPYIYLPIYKGSLIDGKLRSISGVKPQSSTTAQQEVDAASALGTGWQIWDYTSKEMLCDLLTLISKSLDTQGKFGQGHSTGGSSASDFRDCGTLNDKGKFFGYSDTTSQVKCFGMEALWAERWDRELGLILDAGVYKIKEHPAYNFTGEGYTAISASVAQSPTSNNRIKTEVSTQFGSLPTVVGGTSSTFYCDYFYQNQSGIRVAFRGGRCDGGAYAGLRSVAVNTAASYSAWYFGASPVYK